MMASGIRAVSALEASATARSKPATRWKRLTTRSTNAGRSQNVSVRRTRSRSNCRQRHRCRRSHGWLPRPSKSASLAASTASSGRPALGGNVAVRCPARGSRHHHSRSATGCLTSSARQASTVRGMHQRELGNSGPQRRRPIGLGCMGMSASYGTAGQGESTATIHHALDLGVTCSTPPTRTPSRTRNSSARRRPPRRGGDRHEVRHARTDGHPTATVEHIRGVRRACDASCAGSASRHRPLLRAPRRSGVPIEETVGALAGLVGEGKVRWIGLSRGVARRRCAAPPPCTPSPRCRWSTPCYPRRRGRATGPAGNSASASSPTPRSGGACWPVKRSRARRARPPPDPAPLQPAHATATWCWPKVPVAAEIGCTRRRPRSRGCSRRGGRRAIPGTGDPHTWRRTPAPAEVELGAEDLARLDAETRRAVGVRYDENGMAGINL